MKVYLKSKKSKFKRKLIIIVLLIIVIVYLQKNLNYYYLNYSENEASKIITNTVSESVNNKVLDIIKNEGLYKVIYNNDNEIEMIEYDSYLVNIFLRDITSNLTKTLSYEEHNNSKAVFYIPLGSIFQSPMLVNKGPKIPVKMELVGSVTTRINSRVKDYGINNSLIETVVHIVITERIILPMSAKNIKVTSDIPISYRIIKGQIPNYYSGTNSSYIVPIE